MTSDVICNPGSFIVEANMWGLPVANFFFLSYLLCEECAEAGWEMHTNESNVKDGRDQRASDVALPVFFQLIVRRSERTKKTRMNVIIYTHVSSHETKVRGCIEF